MTDEHAREIEAFNAERNAMLLKGDIKALKKFQKKHGMLLSSNDEVAWITLHKTITGVMSLPLELRKASKVWLTERGYHSLDDGEL